MKKWQSTIIKVVKWLFIGIFGFIVILMTAYYMFGRDADLKAEKEAKEQAQTELQENLKQLDLSFEKQNLFNGKQKNIVWVENKSKQIFTGNLAVMIKTESGNRLIDKDMVFIENLNPGQKTFAVIWTKPSFESTFYEYYWQSANFQE